MPVEFRCEKCGKLLNVEAEPGAKVKCPYCKAKVVAPAGVASLPRPQVPAGSASASPPTLPPEPEQPVAVGGDDAVIGVMAAIMPWLISAFFHVGLLVILGFITIVMIREDPQIDTVAASEQLSATPGGVVNPGQTHKETKPTSNVRTNRSKWSDRDSKVNTSSLGQTNKRVDIFGDIGGGGGGGQAADFGRFTGGSGQGPRSKFFGTGGNAYHIVYLVDRSGSMIDTFDQVRKEMRRSILRLSEQQTFHVIFYARGTPMENPPRRLVYATSDQKRLAMTYLDKIHADGQTDPIPALERAFAVLKSRPGNKKGALVYLLTDGDFADNERVLKRIRELNPGGKVVINTVLHHFEIAGRASERPVGENVLQSIAQQNKGIYKFVQADE